jgi:SET domain-containing protein
MLIVETFLEDSPKKGVGLYSTHFIPKGNKWWVRNELFDKVTSKAEFEKLPLLAQEFIKTYGFLEPTGRWYLCIDNARFSNHSDSPNSENELNENGEIISCFAIRDINPNEEILCNYRETCQTCVDNLGFENIE